ncbi:hypothetical protein Rhopal_003200-T1 [Rhodotorula paludigena]|uniref:Uncharacterized protein n=1 Tax=Rhodotorula paludigena TaxID=86838 RepID=A0AAV5GCJ0_9BASI|nr:hypothetical protein Rhopal_003200-T1 [Rhodotorula paludigena]
MLREAVRVSAGGVDLSLTGSVGVRMGARLEKPGDRPQKRERGGGFGWKGSGRVELALESAATDLAMQAVYLPTTGDVQPSQPGLAVVSSALEPGHVSTLLLAGFVPFAWIERLLPRLRNTSVVRWFTQQLVKYLIREVVEGHVVDDLLADLAHFAAKHVEPDSFASLSRDDRDTFLRRHASLSPPAGLPSSDAAAPPVRLSAVLSGPLHIHSLALRQSPSETDANGNAGDTSVPVFARSDQTGLRYSILSSPLLNQLTRGPPAVTFSPGTFDRLSFSEAVIELAPAALDLLEPRRSATAARERGLAGERELVLRVHGLEADLSLAFRIVADLRTAPSLLLGGQKTLEERGVAVTRVEGAKRALRAGSVGLDGASSESSSGMEGDEEEDEGLSIHLPLKWDKRAGRVVLSGKVDEPSSSFFPTSLASAAGHARIHSHGSSARRARKIRLEGAFATVAPRVKLESRLGKALGEKVVNALLDGVKTHLAGLAAPLASYFLADVAQQRLQRAIDDVCETLRDEGGVIWTLAEPPQEDGS